MGSPGIGRCLEVCVGFFGCHNNPEELLAFSGEDREAAGPAVGGTARPRTAVTLQSPLRNADQIPAFTLFYLVTT